MKKLRVLFFYVFTCTSFISCMHNGHDINITYNEDAHYYSMNAHFPKSETRDVDEYMDDKIGRRSKMSFMNSRIDGTIALDDHTKFYIKKSPGILEIKLDKDENTDESYHEIKLMCQGIKKILAHN